MYFRVSKRDVFVRRKSKVIWKNKTKQKTGKTVQKPLSRLDEFRATPLYIHIFLTQICQECTDISIPYDNLFLSRCLTHCDLVTPYGDIDQVQHWLKQWLVAWRHQAITLTNVDSSLVLSNDIRLGEISQHIAQPSIIKIASKKVHLKSYSNPPGVNELTHRLV